MVLHGTICIIRFVLYDSYLVNLFIQIWKDRTHPIFWESYHTHFNLESCHDFAIYMFRLVKSNKLFHVRLPLEILRNSSKPFPEAATGGVPQKGFCKHFKIFTGKHLCWGLFFNKVAGHHSCNFIKTWIPKQIFPRLQNKYFLWLLRNLQ